MNFKKIIISRVDSIGDVVLTLPLCGILKETYPNATIIFLGNTYTQSIIDCCDKIDAFLNWDEIKNLPEKEQIKKIGLLNADLIIHIFPQQKIAALTKSAKIPYRVGTRNRWYHWLYCNRLVALSRRNSDLHEAQLNLKLIESFITKKDFSKDDLIPYYGLKNVSKLSQNYLSILSKNKFNLIIHPASKGSAREWSLENYASLILDLPKDKFQIFISGTEQDKQKLKHWLETLPDEVVDLTGKFLLNEFIAFINSADGIIAASTGPLHIASALGKFALGLYPPIRPMHAGRWSPIGKNASFLSIAKECDNCRKRPSCCSCMNEIKIESVSEKIIEWKKEISISSFIT